MMRRRMAWLLALGLLLGGLAACGDDGDGDATVVEEGGDGASSDEGASDEGASDEGASDEGGSGNVIDEYCDKVQDLREAADELQANPADEALQQEVQDLTEELGERATELASELATYSADDVARFQACQEDAAG